MKYHINDRGEAGRCGASTGPCPFGSASMHFDSPEAARAAYESRPSFSTRSLDLSHGQWVEKDEVEPSSFLREVVAKRGNNRYGGPLEEVAELAKAHFSNARPGVGSEDGDVVLVRVPSKNFFTDIVEITEANRHLVVESLEARVEGEAPVAKLIFPDLPPSPAEITDIVCYRADTLARDDNRSSTAEWEVVAILTQPYESVPMHPTTMERNSRREKGGTYREYSEEEWREARDFWSRHAYATGRLKD